MRRHSAVPLVGLVGLVGLVLLASCSSDGERTRPTLPSRTTVASSEPGATAPPATDPPATDPPPVQSTVPAPEATPPGTEATPPGTDATPPGTDATVPATTAPVTAAPTTAAPVTAAPTTAAPDTVPVTEPSPETTAPVEVDGEGDDDGITWWPWALLAGFLGGLAALLLRRRGPKWPEKVTVLLDELDSRTAHLSAHTPEGLRAIAQTEAAALASLRARLRDLVAAAPDDQQRALLAPLTVPVADLHTVVGAVALSPLLPTPEEHQAVVRAAAVVNTTSATARVSIVPPPPPPSPSNSVGG